MKCSVILIVVAFFSYLAGNAQNITNKGKEFWVGYGHHQYMEPGCNGTGGADNDMNMVIYLSAEEPAVVTVTVDSSGPFPVPWYSKTYTIPANTVISTENMPKGTVNALQSSSNPNYDARLYTDPPPSGSGGEGIFRRKGIHIVSNVPIVAYAHIYGGVSSGATMLMPVTAWGYSYTSLNSQQRDVDRSYSWMYVIAKENNTKVRITPSVVSRLGKQPNQAFDVSLQKGQIYQLIGQADCVTGDGVELTGTTVRSIAGPDGECHAVAVFSGCSRTGGETYTCGTGSGRDNDMQQLFPEQTWGKRYLTAPFSKGQGATPQPSQFQTSVFKVLVKDPATVVKLNGVQLTGLINNKYYKFSSNTTDSIIADKPVMVGQFMSGTSTCNGGQGDPEMVYLSPMEQAIKRIGFYRNTRQAITVNFVTLIVPTAGVNSRLLIDGSASYYTYPHATPGYTVVVKGWAAEEAQCIVTCDSAFTAITYGLGGAESYAYNAGTYLNNLNGISDLHNTADTTNQGNNSHLFTCTGSPVQLSILMRYQPTKLVWQLSSLGTSIMPNRDVTIDPASSAFKGTVTLNGILYYKYTLPDTYTFTSAGKFDVPVLSTSPSLTDNCNNTEELNISFEVKPSPSADFTFSNPSGCVKDTTFFSGPLATGISDAQQWLWTFPDGTVSHQQDTGKVLITAGNNTVSLRVVSKEGCVANVSKTVRVEAAPAAGFTFNPPPVCEGNNITFTPTASYAGAAPVNSYYWDFANATTVIVTTPDPQTILYGSPTSYEVKMVAGISKLCISDTIKHTVTIYSKPQVAVSYPAGCLPDDGVVTFNNTTSTPDGQTLISHAWNFGDASATAGNPNTSAAASPSHTYTTVGDYDIRYGVVSSQGCRKDTVIKATFNIAPKLAYPALAAVCENEAPFSIATGSVTNGIAGTYVYSGPGTNAAGLFDPAAAGPGTHTITYTFTSTANCVVSKTQQITVKARPFASFKSPAGACLPTDGKVSFVNNSSISTNETLTWLWNFNDSHAATGNENTSTAFEPVHRFADGTYQIKLQVIATASGCKKDTTVEAELHVTPVVDYPALSPVCESAAAYSVATATVNGAVVTGGAYSGSGVTTDGQFTPATAGAGTHTLTYGYTTAGGCAAVATSAVEVKARPTAVFAVNKDACLDANTTITPAANASVQYWNWKLGDSRTRLQTNSNAFDITYAATGDYTISLITTDRSGCTSLEKTAPVSIHPVPVADFTVPVKICLPGSAQFNNKSTVSDNSTLAYLWSFGDGTPVQVTDKDPFHAYARAGNYPVTVTATSAFGCKKTSVVKNVSDFYDRPTAVFNVAPAELCQGTDAVFTDASTPAASINSWRWDFGDQSDAATSHTAVKKFENPGTYTVLLTVANKIGCSSELSKRVTVHLQPVVDAGRSFVAAEGATVQFEAKANAQGLSARWTPATGLSDPYSLTPKLLVKNDESYKLTVTGEFNCAASDSLTVKMVKTLKIPNAFTPNGDQVNDLWLIPDLSDYPGCSVQIFNRYGQKVLEVSGYATPWDGKMNGKQLPAGTYYYIIKLENGFSNITGSVTIIR